MQFVLPQPYLAFYFNYAHFFAILYPPYSNTRLLRCTTS
jgi:hypothetical protein